MFKKNVRTPNDVRTEISVFAEHQKRHVLVRNPYLGHFMRKNSILFVPERTLVQEDRRVKGNFAGAVLLGRELPQPDKSSRIPVAIPTGSTHDNRSYRVTAVESGDLTPRIVDEGNRYVIAHEAATLALYGYLSGELEAQKLYAAEHKVPLLRALAESM